MPVSNLTMNYGLVPFIFRYLPGFLMAVNCTLVSWEHLIGIESDGDEEMEPDEKSICGKKG
jgi:hypothetical protein